MSSKGVALFSPPKAGRSRRKSHRNPVACPSLPQVCSRSESLAAAVPAWPVVSVHVALHPAAQQARAFAAKAATVTGQDGEAALLAVIKRLVERVGGIGD